MIVKIFGHWINPFCIQSITDYGSGVYVNLERHCVTIENKTPDEVAIEIARVMDEKGFYGCVEEVKK
jgi:hypothetical protein